MCREGETVPIFGPNRPSRCLGCQVTSVPGEYGRYLLSVCFTCVYVVCTVLGLTVPPCKYIYIYIKRPSPALYFPYTTNSSRHIPKTTLGDCPVLHRPLQYSTMLQIKG